MAATGMSSAANRRAVGVLVGLLALATFINALDRGNFATAAPLVKDELRLSNSQIGVLLSAFFWAYVPGHALSGWLAERINGYRTLAGGLALWAMATLLTGFAGGFATLFVLRLLLGLGESAVFPACSKLLAMNVPGEHLASANAKVSVGINLGNGAGVLIGGLLLAHYGWHVLFFVFGGFSLLWLIPWWTVTRPEPLVDPVMRPPLPVPSYADMLAKREMWGAMIGHFSINYPYFMVLAWLPLYLVKQQGYSITGMAWLAGTVFLLSAIVGLFGGRLADRWIAKGWSINRVRKTMIVAAMSAALICMLACATGNPRLVVAGLLTYSFANGLGSFSVFSIGQTLAGPDCAGKWMGLQNGFAGLSGVIGPLLMGVLIDTTGDYRAGFLVAAVIACIGIVCWSLVIRRVEPVRWSR